jgi:uncharacterized membrane protein
MQAELDGAMRGWTQVAAQAIELLAVAIIVVAILVGTARFLVHRANFSSYNQYKEILERALLLALNVLVAADIIRTVALEPTLTNLIGLGLLVVIRTFLNWSLFVELEQRWPWSSERSIPSERKT